MSVVRVELVTGGAKGAIDSKYRRSYTQVWRIKSDDPTDTPCSILAEVLGESNTPASIPDLWEPYSIQDDSDTDVYLTSLEIVRFKDDESTRLDWIATGTFGLPGGDEGGDPPNPNPLLEPIRYSFEWSNYTKIAEQDNGIKWHEDHPGDPVTPQNIVNSVGDKFDPPVEIDDARPVLVAVRNMANLADIIALAIKFKNAVNTDTFYGAPPRTAKVESIASGEIQERNGIYYYRVVIRVQFNDKTWDVSLVDRGTQRFRTLPGGTIIVPKIKERVAVMDGPNKGQPMEIANLNADGTQRADGLPALLKSPAYRVYPEWNFTGTGGLGIGGA